MKRPDVLSALQRAVDQLHTAASNVLSAVEDPEDGAEGVWITIGSGEKKNYILVSKDGSVTVLARLPQAFSTGQTAVSLSGRPADLPSRPCPACGGSGQL